MPKEGYSSLTIPLWIEDCLKDLQKPGQSQQGALEELLEQKLGREVIQKKYFDWRAKFGINRY